LTITVDDILKIITALTPLVLAILAWQSNQNKQQSKANGEAIAATAAKVDEVHSAVVGQADTPQPDAPERKTNGDMRSLAQVDAPNSTPSPDRA